MTDLVDAVAATVDYDEWTIDNGVVMIPQLSSAETVHDMLRWLDVQPGMCVMEIGTGSGYSGAMLSRLVGDSGRVVSVDIDSDLVERARERHRRSGHRNTEVYVADGMNGWGDADAYDRIVGWVAPHLLSRRWVEQARPGGVIVTPVKIADVAAANALVRCVVEDGGPGKGELRAGSFVEMAPEVITEFGLPIRYVDAVRRPVEGLPWWVSGHGLRDAPGAAAGLLDRLADNVAIPGFIDGAEPRWEAFVGFLLATTPRPASVGGPYGWGAGTATRDSIAVCTSGGMLLTAGSDAARAELTSIRDEWRRHGEPGFDALTTRFRPDDDGGWSVRPQL